MSNLVNGELDELLMLILGIMGLLLTALFLAMPALRVFSAVVMPTTIAGGAFLSWGLLYAARTSRTRRPAVSVRGVPEEL